MKKAQLKELLTQYGPIEYIWFDHAVGDGGLSHAETIALCKSLQPGCFVGFNHGDQEGADIRLGEMGRPGPLDDPRGRRAVHERRAEQELPAGRVHLSDPAAARGRSDVVLFAADPRRALPSGRRSSTTTTWAR